MELLLMYDGIDYLRFPVDQTIRIIRPSIRHFDSRCSYSDDQRNGRRKGEGWVEI